MAEPVTRHDGEHITFVIRTWSQPIFCDSFQFTLMLPIFLASLIVPSLYKPVKSRKLTELCKNMMFDNLWEEAVVPIFRTKRDFLTILLSLGM
jgi:hypothetical protein